MILSTAGCAEIELGSEVYKNITRSNESRPAQPVSRRSVRQDNIDSAMREDPQAFHATGHALWDGARTLRGVWIAHPMAAVARRVRLTNDETGTQVDAAMFRRDPNLSGPRIIVSSEAAELLGLTPGHGTAITIKALAYRTIPVSAADADGPADQPEGARIEAEVIPISAEAPAPRSGPAGSAAQARPADVIAAVERAFERDVNTTSATGDSIPDGNAAIAVESDRAESTGMVAPAVTAAPTPRPGIRSVETAPNRSGRITDGRIFVQAGIFSQSQNAARLIETLRAASLLANALQITLGEKQFTRVLVGPYHTIAERDAALETVRRIGPADAILARG